MHGDAFPLKRLEQGQRRRRRKSATLGGIMVEGIESAQASVIQYVVDIVGQIRTDGLTRNRDPTRPLLRQIFHVPSPWSREDCRSSTSSAALAPVSSRAPARKRPESGNPGQAGKAVPLVGQVQVEQPFARPGSRGILIFKRQQGRIANQQSRVGHGEHGFEIRRMRDKLRRHLPENLEQDARVGVRGADEVSAATLRTALTPCSGRTTKIIDRTRSREAMAQPGTIASEGVVAWAATGTRPISASPAASSAAQPEGVVYQSDIAHATRCARVRARSPTLMEQD